MRDDDAVFEGRQFEPCSAAYLDDHFFLSGKSFFQLTVDFPIGNVFGSHSDA